MDSLFVKIKELKKQLAIVEEIIVDSLVVQTILDGLQDSYQSFASNLRFYMKGNPTSMKFEMLMVIILQEE